MLTQYTTTLRHVLHTTLLSCLCLAALAACDSEDPPPTPAKTEQPAPAKPENQPKAPTQPDGSAPIGDPNAAANTPTKPPSEKPKDPPTLDDLPDLAINDDDEDKQPPKDVVPDEDNVAAALNDPNRTEDNPPTKPSRSKTLSVIEAVVARDVKDRKPVDKGTSFHAPVTRLFAWLKIRNDGEPATIQTVWKWNGRVMDRMDLNVGKGKGWRTWSRKTIGKKHSGPWTVDVVDPDGGVLKTLSFQVIADGGVPKNLD